nr:TRAP transporter substrate-binding protein DctP [uncultured Treponema sp.]
MKALKKIFILAAAVLSQTAFAQTTIKIASVAPARSSWDVQQRQIAKEWATITNGEIILQFMTSDAMGGEGGVVKKLNAVRPGQKAPIGGAVFTSMGLDDFAPKSNVMTLCAPFMFRNQDEVNAVLKEFTPTMQKAFDEKGYVVLGWFNIGWAYFFTSKPAYTPDELRKVRLATGGLTSPALSNAFKSAGYLTQDVPADKLQSSISSGDVEGLFTIPMYAYAAQYYKNLVNVNNIPLAPVMVGFIMNKKDWEAIPDKYKPALMQSIKKAEAKFIADQKKMDAEYLSLCEKNGCKVFNPTDAQKKVWEDSFRKDLHFMYEGSNPVVNKQFYEQIEVFLKKYRGE